MKPLHRVFQFLFLCHHGGMSRVFTIKQRTYQVCFECGQEIDYSWEQMRSTEQNPAADAMVRLDNRNRPSFQSFDGQRRGLSVLPVPGSSSLRSGLMKIVDPDHCTVSLLRLPR